MSQAMNSNEDYCSFTLPSDLSQGGLPGEADICKDLEDSDPAVKRAALKSAIMAMLGGEALPKVLMQVIRFCINTEDHQLKKLMMLYWEVVPKYQPQVRYDIDLVGCEGALNENDFSDSDFPFSLRPPAVRWLQGGKIII